MAAIIPELQRQITLEQYNDQRQWNFLAAVITNAVGGIAGMFAKRKPKKVEPDDFLSKQAKRLYRELTAKPTAPPTGDKWAKHIADAQAKGLAGPGEGW